MSWLYSQALVEEYLGDICLDGEQSVQSNGNLTQQAYCAPDKMTAFSRLSRFGMTYKPLTEDRGEELLTLFREDFHAKTSQLQDEGTDLKENVQECGKKWPGLLAKYDPNSHLWRTVQCSLLEDLNESLQTLQKWGMTVGGELYLRPTLVQTIEEREFGLWRTPDTCAGGALSEKVILQMASGDWKRPSGALMQLRLQDQVRHPNLWPTPVARMWKDNGSPSEYKRNEIPLAAQVGGKLNPTWTEWLMGWPLGWTDLKPLEMDKSLFVQQPLGSS